MTNISCYKMLAYLFQIFIPHATSPARCSSVFAVINSLQAEPSVFHYIVVKYWQNFVCGKTRMGCDIPIFVVAVLESIGHRFPRFS